MLSSGAKFNSKRRNNDEPLALEKKDSSSDGAYVAAARRATFRLHPAQFVRYLIGLHHLEGDPRENPFLSRISWENLNGAGEQGQSDDPASIAFAPSGVSGFYSPTRPLFQCELTVSPKNTRCLICGEEVLRDSTAYRIAFVHVADYSHIVHQACIELTEFNENKAPVPSPSVNRVTAAKPGLRLRVRQHKPRPEPDPGTSECLAHRGTVPCLVPGSQK